MAGKPIVQQLQDDISEIIDRYRDQGLTYGEAIGALEMVKLDIWHEDVEHDLDSMI